MTPLLDTTAVHHRRIGVVAVGGHDRLEYLHTLLSQHVADARPGKVADFLHLDAKGNPRAAGRLVVHAERVLCVTPRQVAADFAAALEQYRFLLQVEVADLSGDWAMASIRGPGPVTAPGARSEEMTAAPHGPGMVIRDRSGGVDLLGPTDWVGERAGELGLPEADDEQWDAWRILHGEPAWSTELATGRRAQELGVLPTHVHLQKGCYPGQESIAKIYNLGRPRRALAVLELDAPVGVGSEVEVDGQRGEITSAARRGDGAVALALLPLDRATGDIPGDGAVRVGAVRGRVVRKVGEGLPQPGAPATPRR